MNNKNFKIRNKKLLSLILAGLFTLMPIAKGRSERTLVSEQSNIYINIEDDVTTYERYDAKAREYHNISIFDDENIASHQYGASQRDFKNHFEELISDPLIWDELQVYFPESDFESHEEAVFFYQKYLYLIYECGCGYAAAADYVFHTFEGKEKEFEDIFGYPMYIVRDDGFVDFNYEIFILKFFNYSVIKEKRLRKKVMSSIMKDVYEFRLNNFTNDQEYKEKRKEIVKNMRTLTNKQLIEWNNYENERTTKFHELYTKWKKTPKEYYNFGIPTDASYGYLYVYLGKHGIVLNTEAICDAIRFSVDDIVASENFSLYDDKYFDEEKVDGQHYVYVSEITPNGKIIVSSWGNKYIFDNSEALWTDKVLLKIKK